MISKLKKIKSTSAFNYAFSALVSALSNLIALVYLGKVLSSNDFALLIVFSSITFFSIPALTISSIGLISVNFVKLSNNEFDIFKSKLRSFALLSALILYAVIVALYALKLKYLNQYFLFINMLMIYSFFKVQNEIEMNSYIIKAESSKFLYYTIAGAISSMLLLFIMDYLFGYRYMNRIFSFLFSEILIFFYRNCMNLNKFNDLRLIFNIIDIGFVKEIIKFGSPLFISLFVSWLYSESDKFIILNFFNMDMVGKYGFAFSLATSLNSLNQILVNIFLPDMYKNFNRMNKPVKFTITHETIRVTKVLLPASIILAFVASYLSRYFSEKQFEETSILICIVIVGYLLNGMYRPAGLFLEFKSLNSVKLMLLSISSLIGVIFGWYLTSRNGVTGAAFGFVISNFLLFFTTYFYARSRLG